MSKPLLFAVVMCLPVSVSLAEVEDTLNMEIRDGTMGDAARLINDSCEHLTGPLEVQNPDAVLSLRLENATCDQVVRLLREYDAGAA